MASLKKEFGDFQTPLSLARRVAALVGQNGRHFGTIIEPTCGVGAFLQAAAERFGTSSVYMGFDVNPDYVEAAKIALARIGPSNAKIQQRDFYTIKWKQFLSKQLGPVLIIGNPPWITNSGMGVINGKNLPEKSNFQGHSGLDAMTGKANFDISEWMLVELADAFQPRGGTLAMLVKTVVARKLLVHCWANRIPIIDAAIYRIDAAEHFDAAVDASLVVIEFGEPASPCRAEVYEQLSRVIKPAATIALEDGMLVADLDAYRATKHFRGGSTLRWRSGIKHDCSKVMELEVIDGKLKNGLGEFLDLEPDYLLPMFKTSEVAGGRVGHCHRRMIVTQRCIGEQTAGIAERAPKTWSYLQRHRALLAKRGSSIYRGKPEFSIFGVGDYTFSPWKIAISGMYKNLKFVIVGPCQAKPAVFDDTTNFIPCPSEAAATMLLSLLDSDVARTFYRAFIFWDAKRPITVDLLGRLNLHSLAESHGISNKFARLFGHDIATSSKKLRAPLKVMAEPMLWPDPVQG
ncbi:MAG TPA: methyltransferase domain-containing protein [Tepidisphaeraceae bacterium]|nr:methyltransferase domain-containing protein [Tepidisphaeraceae bacterium]